MDLYMSLTRELEATRASKHLMFQSYTLRITKQQLRFCRRDEPQGRHREDCQYPEHDD